MINYKSSDKVFLLSLLVNIVLGCLLYLNLAWLKAINLPNHTFPENTYIKFEDAKEVHEKYPVDFLNATAVFNTIHGALKQKNSDLFPIGVSFIPAYIPPNTPLYHSTGSKEIPQLFEWIAMDYEFSYDFAHFIRHKAPNGHHGPNHPDDNVEITNHRGPDFSSNPGYDKSSNERKGPRNGLSYMYTFRNIKPLTKLIYLDGASASKRSSGEMDQQLILSRQQDINGRVDEYEAAEKICKWGEAFGLEGIIRLEVGFEIILCDFKNDVELISNITLNNVTELISFPDESLVPLNDLEKKRTQFLDIMQSMSGFEHLQAGHLVDEGEPRIILDFSRMVTPLNRTWIDPDPYVRRINALSVELKESIIHDLELNLNKQVTPTRKSDWQAITNHIVDKLGPMMVLLNNTLSIFDLNKDKDLADSLEYASRNITKLTYNFVRRYSDDTIKDKDAKLQNALDSAIIDFVYHTYPLTSQSEYLIYSSIYKVHHEVISTIFRAFDTSKRILKDFFVEPSESRYEEHKSNLLVLKQNVIELIANLRWSIFTRCSLACNWDEVCYIPTWGPGPMGFGHDWFEFDGERYRIGQELHCVSYKEVGGF